MVDGDVAATVDDHEPFDIDGTRLIFLVAIGMMAVPTSADLLSFPSAGALLALVAALCLLQPTIARNISWSRRAQRRSLYRPLQIPIEETSWQASEVEEMSDAAIARVDRLLPRASVTATDAAMMGGLADGLARSAVMIQAHWRGKQDRGVSREGSWSGRWSEASQDSSPHARAKWHVAKRHVSTLNDIVSHWLNFVLPESDKARIAKLPNKVQLATSLMAIPLRT